MSKPRSLSWLPSRSNGALFPAACAGALAVLGVLQLLLTVPEAEPLAGQPGGSPRVRLPEVRMLAVDPVLLRSPLFTPQRAVPTGSAPSAAGGERAAPVWALAGSISFRGRQVAILQGPDGRSARLPVGASVAGLRLLALDSSGALVSEGGVRRRLGYGQTMMAAGAASPAPDPNAEEQSE